MFNTALLSVPSLYVSSATIDSRKITFFFFNVTQPSLTHPTQLRLLYCTALYLGMYTFVIHHAALPLIPEPVHPHVFAYTSRTSSCLLASKIGKRQNSILATLHHTRHAPSRHARQTSCIRIDQQSAGEITRDNKHARELMRGNARGKDRPNYFKCYGKGFLFVAYETTNLYT